MLRQPRHPPAPPANSGAPGMRETPQKNAVPSRQLPCHVPTPRRFVVFAAHSHCPTLCSATERTSSQNQGSSLLPEGSAPPSLLRPVLDDTSLSPLRSQQALVLLLGGDNIFRKSCPMNALVFSFVPPSSRLDRGLAKRAPMCAYGFEQMVPTLPSMVQSYHG